MAMLRRLPKILKYIPGKAQDMRAWFLSMQYWLGGSDDNLESMIRFLVSRYSGKRDWAKVQAAAPIDYPMSAFTTLTCQPASPPMPPICPAPPGPPPRWAC